jgi:hypothetical protein
MLLHWPCGAFPKRLNLKLEGEIKERIWRLKNERRWNQNEGEIKTKMNRNEWRWKRTWIGTNEGWTWGEARDRQRSSGATEKIDLSAENLGFVVVSILKMSSFRIEFLFYKMSFWKWISSHMSSGNFFFYEMNFNL